jgi:predicted signal transduction protein with EAL and GGDEF domain
LIKSFRKSDYIIRWGGEEFLVAVRFANRYNAPNIAEELRLKVESTEFRTADDIPIKISCSIGFSTFPISENNPETYNWEQTIDLADHCLYAAKRTSRNAWVSIAPSHSTPNYDMSFIKQNTKRLIDESKFVLSTSVIDTQKIVWNSHNLLD